MTNASTKVLQSASNKLPFDLERLQCRVEHRKTRVASLVEKAFSLEELTRVARSKSDGEIDDFIDSILACSIYLEFVMEQASWWMGTADAAMSEQHAAFRGEICRVTNSQYALRSLLLETLALVPAAWHETFSHSDYIYWSPNGRKLVARYLEFREAVCVAIEEIWDSYPDRSIFKEMRQLS